MWRTLVEEIEGLWGREREVTEIRRGDHGRSLGLKLELGEGGRKNTVGNPSPLCRRRQNTIVRGWEGGQTKGGKVDKALSCQGYL